MIDTLFYESQNIGSGFFNEREFDIFSSYEINYLQNILGCLSFVYLDINDLNSVSKIYTNTLDFVIIKYVDEWYMVRIDDDYYRCDTFDGVKNLIKGVV